MHARSLNSSVFLFVSLRILLNLASLAVSYTHLFIVLLSLWSSYCPCNNVINKYICICVAVKVFILCHLHFIVHCVCYKTGNGKQPTILGQMIAEAREIRENQSCRNTTSNAVKQNHIETVSTNNF